VNNLKYAVEQRLRFIDFLVHHYGSINRGALTDYFGISVPQASIDLGDYMKLAPSNLVYDKTLKSYVKGPDFKRVWA
jgi:hypothetical protein